MHPFSVKGRLVDVHRQTIYPAGIMVEGERITAIRNLDDSSPAAEGPFILPGFIDAHIHIESSMLIPSEFARLAVVHGTVATVSDPHEIANVCGVEGVEFMIENGGAVPFKFNFGAPSCVPATVFETAGAALDSKAVDLLLQREEVLYLSEMMNFPGVLHGDKEVAEKISAAQKWSKPVDGHAPGLRGEAARQYINAGISTDHECFTAEEALDKLQYGMKILIREGSAAKNFEALSELLHDHSDSIMFCSDDKHPDSLVEGHINQLCARAVAKGIDVFKVLKAACVNPVGHYKLKVGLLRENDFADFILVKDLQHFEVLQTYVNGQLVAEEGKSLISSQKPGTKKPVNNFSCEKKETQDFKVSFTGQETIPVIEALDGQLITNKIFVQPKVEGDAIVSDIENDVLKIVVVNRYKNAPIAKAFIKNFGLKSGAIASSVAHDSHNIVAVGVDDESICQAVNLVIEKEGGVSVASPNSSREGLSTAQPLHFSESGKQPASVQSKVGGPDNPPLGGGGAVVPLPVGGLMSTDDGYKVADDYAAIDKAAKELGSTLSAPFMTLSFMALLVIPHLKLSDLGLFDGDHFSFVDPAHL